MHISTRHLKIACLVTVVIAASELAGCSKRCPEGSGLSKGQCIPVQQTAGQGATEEKELPSTQTSSTTSTTGEAGRSAPAANQTVAGAGSIANPSQAGAAAPSAAGSSASDDEPSEPVSDACAPSEELCDNMDNDCDGKIDEVTRACQDLPAPCAAGVLACRDGVWDDEETQCEGAVVPVEEACDEGMVDDDCDGVANEGCACNEGETRPCGRSEGICKPGMQTCAGGMWPTECEGAVGNPDEGCDCESGTTEMCNAGRGVCAMGERQCSGGKWMPCAALEQSSPEVCDNLDNDCNGIVDGMSATCDKPNEKCVAPGRCAECTTDRDCSRLTTGCEVGKCQSGTCAADKLEEYAACTSGSTRGYCVDDACMPPRSYRIENTDGDVDYSGNWSETGSVNYSNTAGAYYLVHFVGTRATLYGGRGPDRGEAEYSVCNSNGSGCNSARTQSNHAATLSVQRLWTTPTLPFGEHTLKARVTGQPRGATDTIVDIDYVEVN
jgi:hypothetical protein